MRVLFVFLVAALPLVLPVLAHPRRHSARSVGLAIPISKRNKVRSADGEVNVSRLKASTEQSISSILNGFSIYKINTGNEQPLANGLSQSLSSRSSVRRATGSVPLVDFDSGNLWYGAIEVGDPPKSFTVDFDTGSSDIFLPSISCDSSCDGHARYDPSASQTSVDLNKSFELEYGSGDSVSGEQYNDTVSIAGLTARNQTLGAAMAYPSSFNENNFPADGLMGMAYQSISAYNSPPLFQNLVAQGQVTEPRFAFKLAESGAELYLGGTNPKLYEGVFTYVPVTDESYWQTCLTAVFVNEYPIPLSDNSVIIDTGTTFIIGNEKDVKAIYAQIPGSQPADPKYGLGEGFYTIPCDFNTVVSFMFGLKEFPVSPSIFNFGSIDTNVCLGGLIYDPYLSSLNLTFWIMGDVFLQNVYTVFDLGNNLIGFADLASDD